MNAIIKGSGKLDAITTYEDTGLSPKISENPTSLSVETLHSNESFTISIMRTTPTQVSDIDFILRSKETLGTELKEENKKDKRLDFISALMSGFSVFAMGLLFLISGVTGSKSDFIFYIAAKFGFKEILKNYSINSINSINMNYLRFGDILYSEAATSDAKKISKVILALKSMLLNKTIAVSSRKSIIRNIMKLEGDNYSEKEVSILKEKSKSVFNLIDIRNLIDDYVENPQLFLNQEENKSSK